MGKRVNPELKIVPKSVGFRFYQHRFFAMYPEFKPDTFCREAIDKQIREIDITFLEEKDETTN